MRMGTFIFIYFFSVLAQVKDFLPRLAEANQILKEKVENGEGDAIDIETIEDSTESVIQMVSYNMGLVPTKLVFRVSDKVRYKPACSATETS